jgi:hypothetical protein
VSNFERIVHMRPAYDKRDSDPKKNYGIHGVNLTMILKGEEGAVQFVLFTNWQLPHVQKETYDKHFGDRERIELFTTPMAADLGYHWPTERYEGQTVCKDKCDWLNGPCYYDGSSLNAERVFEVLLREGSEGVWRELESFYESVRTRD